jgi:hypothetical protein
MPALLEIQVRPLGPFFNKALIQFSGRPLKPKPPIIRMEKLNLTSPPPSLLLKESKWKSKYMN